MIRRGVVRLGVPKPSIPSAMLLTYFPDPDYAPEDGVKAVMARSAATLYKSGNRIHVVSSAHVAFPMMYPSLYPPDQFEWVFDIPVSDLRFELRLVDDRGGIIAQLPLLSRVFRHAHADVAALHIPSSVDQRIVSALSPYAWPIETCSTAVNTHVAAKKLRCEGLSLDLADHQRSFTENNDDSNEHTPDEEAASATVVPASLLAHAPASKVSSVAGGEGALEIGGRRLGRWGSYEHETGNEPAVCEVIDQLDCCRGDGGWDGCARLLLKTEQPLELGMCGGAVVAEGTDDDSSGREVTDGALAGLVESKIPPSAARPVLSNAAVVIPQCAVTPFLRQVDSWFDIAR